MMNDSIREELEIKPSAPLKPLNLERKGATSMSSKPNQINMSAPPKPVLPTRRDTADLLQKPPISEPKIETPEAKTEPMLVEFQNRNAALPDWRLKMQNAVRQRMEYVPGEEKSAAEPVYQTRLVTSGANALKAEIVEEKIPAAAKNEKVANALKRIEQSRKAFFVEENVEQMIDEQQPAANKNYPFYVAARTAETAPKPVETKASINVLPKPKLVTTQAKTVGADLDTNKLPPLPQVLKTQEIPEKTSTVVPPEVTAAKKDAVAENNILVENRIEETVTANEENEAEDDLAPFAMRFNAGLFDLIIGAFVSMILLAPFMLTGGEWLTFSGFLAFIATISVVMFVYLTTALAMTGRTLGMRLFSLELIDIEENEYPSFHQAAVSSSVYLLSLICGGIGFLPVLFNEEKRAVHDIVSGTIVVKEY